MVKAAELERQAAALQAQLDSVRAQLAQVTAQRASARSQYSAFFNQVCPGATLLPASSPDYPKGSQTGRCPQQRAEQTAVSHVACCIFDISGATAELLASRARPFWTMPTVSQPLFKTHPPAASCL